MPSLTATTPSTASADSTVELPRIGVLGVMQRLYDAMLPGIGERQAEYARELGAALDGIASVTVTQPVQGPRGHRARDARARRRRPRRAARRDADLRAGDEHHARARGHAAPRLHREHPAGPRGRPRHGTWPT